MGFVDGHLKAMTGGAADNGKGWVWDEAGYGYVPVHIDRVQCCSLYKSVSQSLANGAPTAITWDAEREDVPGWHSTSTNPSRLTVTSAGWYRVGVALVWSANSTGQRYVGLRLNGTINLASMRYQAMGESGVVVPWEGRLAANDYIEVIGYQTSGDVLNVVAINRNSEYNSTEFWAVRAGS